MAIDNLSGTFENFDDTLRKWFYDNWTNSNTNSITPRFESPSGRNNEQVGSSFYKSGVAWFDNEQNDEIMFNVRDTVVDPDFTSSTSVVAYITDVYIDIQAKDADLAWKFANEIDRIIINNFPNSATRINKTDGSASAIATFDLPAIEWINGTQPETEAQFSGIRLSGVIGCRWFRTQ